jgi:hypothetical protein
MAGGGDLVTGYEGIGAFAGRVRGVAGELTGAAHAVRAPQTTRDGAVDPALDDLTRSMTYQLLLLSQVLEVLARGADGAVASYTAADEALGSSAPTPRTGGPRQAS